MKNFTYTVISFLLISCSNKSTDLAKEKAINDSLQALVETKNEILSYMFASFNDIESSLDSISGRQKFICMKTETPEKIKYFTVDGINKDINAINTLIKNNRMHIKQLNTKLKSKNINSKELENSVAMLNNRITNKQNELFELKNQLIRYKKKITGLETVIGSLAWDNIALAETVEEETEMLHTAYYILGSASELKKDDIIDYNNNLIKKSKNARLNDDPSIEKFETINYEEITSIPVNYKKIKFITPHPAKSYHLENEGGIVKNISITDPEKFWEISKFLVIVKE